MLRLMSPPESSLRLYRSLKCFWESIDLHILHITICIIMKLEMIKAVQIKKDRMRKITKR